MELEVVIGNPPYQIKDGGNGASAKLLYNLFVQQAKKLNPRYITIVIPSRWFAGGKGLDDFREEMLNDDRIRKIVDYTNAKDCFPGNSIGGGVNYFLWDRDNRGLCEHTNIHDSKISTKERRLNKYPIFVRYNEAINIIEKVLNSNNFKCFSDIVSSRNPFGLASYERGENESFDSSLKLYSSKGYGYIPKFKVIRNKNIVNRYKIMLSEVTSEHAGEANKDGQFRVISTVQILKPDEVCTDSYLVVGDFDNYDISNNVLNYLKTCFFRFLL